jgi:hypothetical protein
VWFALFDAARQNWQQLLTLPLNADAYKREDAQIEPYAARYKALEHCPSLISNRFLPHVELRTACRYALTNEVASVGYLGKGRLDSQPTTWRVASSTLIHGTLKAFARGVGGSFAALKRRYVRADDNVVTASSTISHPTGFLYCYKLVNRFVLHP